MTGRRLLPCLLLIVGACGLDVTIDIDGVPITERDGVVHADGVALPYERWVALEGELPDDLSLSLEAATGDLALAGGDGRAFALEAHLFSEREGDGEVVFDGGRLVARSAGGHGVLVDGLRGTLPSALAALEVRTGVGDVTLADFLVEGALGTSAGTGRIEVGGTRAAELRLEGGSGEVVVRHVTVEGFVVEVGLGAVLVEQSRLGRARIAVGTGDVTVRDCSSEDLGVEVGLGDVDLSGGRHGAVETDVGLGTARVDPASVAENGR